ncbi:MAG: methyltransferase domain-containing protein [Planctomycetes bacterium]|nr:methyltransferase domain-containing protein [Planctomycetota bacterium]
MTTTTKSQVLQTQYEAWPYPQVPLLASLPSTHPWELHTDWLWDRCGSGPAPKRPRIWIAGCGTFEPYAFALANPHAEIVACDLSRTSLAIAKRRCRVHGQRHVQFAPVDLAEPSTWPEGRFDLIECYGVLMNLPDPQATLCALRERLTDRGVLRLMVYPHWSRARVFQIQRVARLLSLHANDRAHPSALRGLMKSLPKSHPLRYAFTSYADSRNDAGVVDGFLHAGDRGFTAYQLGELLAQAGLEPGFWFHRPWAQPDRMAERLDLPEPSQSSVLDYLDLWQELRGNFVVCARRSDAPAREVQNPRPHPLFLGEGTSLRHRLRLQRLRLLGGALPTRTGEDAIQLRPRDARDLRRDSELDRLAATGLVLGGADHGSHLPAHRDFTAESACLAHASALRVGRRAPNPLYAHLFAAFERDRRHPELGLRDLEGQLGRWLPWADPLEELPIAFGLTPYGTALRLRQNVHDHLERTELPTAASYADVRLRADAQCLNRVREFLRDQKALPSTLRDEATLRELFVLLFAHDSLFVTLE